ncbi:MAG TPA: preprotein translocase subunit SecE [Candidatus Saccharimonadales bacterium]|nr:preprotein translocase subunit SecE [Candidatus Saccharimonadales bacterium]
MKKLSLRKKKGTAKKQRVRRPAPRWLKAIGRVLGIIFRPLRPLGRYFAGAWYELRQVSWPSRKSTTKLTIAVIIFTAVMTVFIVTLDFGFEQLVKRILL